MFNKYRERGLSLIPIKNDSKRPDFQGREFGEAWEEYCVRLPTEEECYLWEETKAKRYGLACGPASGVLALDIDSDDPKIISACPYSPVSKRGRKGETRFFRYDSRVPSCKIAGVIDVLGLGKQTVLPPTTHPETGEPYFWQTPDTLENFDICDLPTFGPEDLASLRTALEQGESAGKFGTTGVDLVGGPWTNDDPKRGSPTGSHDRLKVIANAMIARSVTPDEAVRELLRFDEENHFPVGYFSDSTRPDCHADPVTNALFFYASNAKTYNRRQIQTQSTPAIPLISGSELVDVSALLSPVGRAFEEAPWPEPRGGLKKIRDQINEFAVRAQPALSMGGAIAIGAAVIGNRLRLGNTWPNVYVINVAPTGAGKSFPYTTAKRLFSAENSLDLIGSGGFRSSSAMIKDLVGRRERLDLIDECSSLFKVIRDGGVFQQDMLDILNGLYTDSSSLFIGPDSVGRERVQVWHPCVTALMSTTPGNLKGSVNKEFVTGGFLPRCLIFNDSAYGELRKSIWNEARATELITLFTELQKYGQLDRKNMMSPKPEPTLIPIDENAQLALDAYDLDCSQRISLSDTDEMERHFLTRAGVQAQKLALIHGALDGALVRLWDVEWAIATVKASYHNSTMLLPELGAENTQETNVMRVLSIIQSSGSITHSRLIGKTRFLRTSERHEILGSLESEGKIRSAVSDSRAKVWHAT